MKPLPACPGSWGPPPGCAASATPAPSVSFRRLGTEGGPTCSLGLPTGCAALARSAPTIVVYGPCMGAGSMLPQCGSQTRIIHEPSQARHGSRLKIAPGFTSHQTAVDLPRQLRSTIRFCRGRPAPQASFHWPFIGGGSTLPHVHLSFSPCHCAVHLDPNLAARRCQLAQQMGTASKLSSDGRTGINSEVFCKLSNASCLLTMM